MPVSIQRSFFILRLLLGVVMVGEAIFFIFNNNKIYKESPCGCEVFSEAPNGDYDPSEKEAIFNNQLFTYKEEMLVTDQWPEKKEEKVLGEKSTERWIEVDLSEQKLYAHNGDKIDYEFLISSGKWRPTPTGEFKIWAKLRYTKMEGGRRGTSTYYYLPNVPYVQYFYRGYGIHGAYWHNNFGQPMSHGCINLTVPDAEKLFFWTRPYLPKGKTIIYSSAENPGTKVVIHN